MKSHYRFYLVLSLSLFFLLSLSSSSGRRIKGFAISMVAPVWEKTSRVFSRGFASQFHQEEITRLQLENHLLQEKVSEMETLLEDLSKLKTEMANDPVLSVDIELHQAGIRSLFHDSICPVPAKVTYRSPALWDSVLWVNVGEADNEKIGYRAIAKNSPVVLGISLIGVIEEVERYRSLVRLITDDRLTPSVRVLREDEGKKLFLAKGEIHGSGNPFWRSKGHTLKGIGFNCDFPDSESPARDLRSANPLIIKTGDLLVTSGLDGIFPKGFRVGTVSRIETLKEGDYFYTIEAEPDVKHLDSLSFVYILPPIQKYTGSSSNVPLSASLKAPGL